MIAALVDTMVIIHLFRRYSPALTWYATQTQPLGITTISWLEVIAGSNSKAQQTALKSILDQFELLPVLTSDQEWAMQQLARYRLSHGTGVEDCLIASVVYRIQLPLYTQNLKHMTPLLGTLAVKPYA